MKVVSGRTSQRSSRGRIDKRSAILDAAFTVFARQGYTDAGVQEIADEAGVAKPTVYNHLVDKETLFREAVAAAAASVAAENLAVVERLRTAAGSAPVEVRASLQEVALGLLRICCGPRSRALRFLTYGQVARFPDLVDVVMGHTSGRVTDALTDRVAQLVLAGSLRRCDPAVAAEQFLVLVTGPIEARTRLGTRKIAVAEMRAVAHDAVDTFLRAYEPERSRRPAPAPPTGDLGKRLRGEAPVLPWISGVRSEREAEPGSGGLGRELRPVLRVGADRRQ